MNVVPICRRVSRRVLQVLAGVTGLVLISTASCTDEVSTAVLGSLEGLAQELVGILFQSIELGGTATDGGDSAATTVQLITDVVRGIVV